MTGHQTAELLRADEIVRTTPPVEEFEVAGESIEKDGGVLLIKARQPRAKKSVLTGPEFFACTHRGHQNRTWSPTTN